MQYTTQAARNLKPRVQMLIRELKLSTRGMKLSVSRQHRFPCAAGDTIYMPPVWGFGGWDQFATTFLHEWRHVRDTFDGVDCPLAEKEQRANSEMFRYTPEVAQKCNSINKSIVDAGLRRLAQEAQVA